MKRKEIKWLQEFKAFAMKGNVMDMAIGIIIGGAFGKIVTSLVNDIIMPIVGVLIGGVNFSTWKITLREAVMNGAEVVKPAVELGVGNFLQTTLDFFIIALSIFWALRLLIKFKKKEETAPEPPKAPEPTNEEKLLSEIRDLLKNK